MDLYKADKMEMIKEGVLDKTYLALSREPSIPKVGSNLNTDKIIIENIQMILIDPVVLNGISSREDPEYCIKSPLLL